MAKQSGAEVRERLGVMYDPELAEFLKISLATLKNRRAIGNLPPSAKIGREHVTTFDDLKTWLARRRARAA
jgi:hypothetical protein